MIHDPFIILLSNCSFGCIHSSCFFFCFFYRGSTGIAQPPELPEDTEQLWMELLKEDGDSPISRSWRMLESTLTQLAPDCCDAVFHGVVHWFDRYLFVVAALQSLHEEFRLGTSEKDDPL
jgi:hypothetical protein